MYCRVRSGSAMFMALSSRRVVSPGKRRVAAGAERDFPPRRHIPSRHGRYDEGMKPCISEACTMPVSFAEDVAAAAEGGCPAMEVWLTKLETHLETHSVADTRKLLEDRGVGLAAASYQGGLLV